MKQLAFGRILSAVFAALCALSCGKGPVTPEGPLRSSTDTLTWELVNGLDTDLDVRFFDQTFDAWYPSRTTYYSLPPGADRVYELKCSVNANICYGATVHSNQTLYFGVSVYNNQTCGSQGCCHVCDGSTLTAIRLLPR